MICFAMLLHIEPDLGNTDLKTLLQTRSYESLRSSFKTVALLFLFYLHMYMRFSFCFFFLAVQKLVAEVKSLPFSEVKPSHLDSHVLRQSSVLKGVASAS